MKKIQFKLGRDLKIKEFCVSLFRGQVLLLSLFLETGIKTLPSVLTTTQFFNLKYLTRVEAFLLLSHVRSTEELQKH